MSKVSIADFGYSTLLSLDYGKSTGSGFTLLHMGFKFLVTAKHVLYDESNVLRCENLMVTMQAPNGEDYHAEVIEIEMKAAKVLHGNPEDLAVVLLGKVHPHDGKKYEDYVSIQQKGSLKHSYWDSTMTKELSDIRVASEVFLMGYPTSLYTPHANFLDITKPLLRRGIVAGVNTKKNIFVIDCPAYYGNSGAPILEFCDNQTFKVVGLVSRYIPFIVEWKNRREDLVNSEYLNSGYSVCVPMNSVLELIGKVAIAYLN